MFRRLILLTVFSLIAAGIIPAAALANPVPAGPLDNWSVRSSGPTNQNVLGAVYGNGTYVAVGAGGTIATSGDGVNWTSRTSGTTNDLDGVTYGNGMYVAVGASGTIKTSSDGVSWTSRTSGTTNLLYSITYGNGTFVAVGQGGTILTSSDGVSWTSYTSGTNILYGVTYGNSTFVAVGQNGTILTSSDGVSWTSRTSGTPYWLRGVTYGNGTFVAVGWSGTILTSSDGAIWTSRTSGTANFICSVAYGNGTYVAVGQGGTIITSSDGVSWTSRASGPTYNLLGVTYGNGMYVAVGWSGTILTSNDGVSWTNLTLELDGVAYGNGSYVIVGPGGTIMTSSDGASWTSRTSGTTNWLNGVTYSNGTFVAVGQGGTILTSSDGVSWTSRTSGTTNVLYGVSYGNGTYVVVGFSGTILTSGDGVSWTSRTSNTTNSLIGVTYGNGTFVAVGLAGTILTSSDGVSWTSRMSGTTKFLWGVTYGYGTYVAAGEAGTILTSSDGASWTSRTSGTTSWFWGVTYGNGTYVAVGGAGTILTSSDGASWTSRASNTMNWLNGVAYGNGTYVVTGYNRTILQSASTADAGNNVVTASANVITKGSSVTMSAYGDRQSAAGAMAGDERYLPSGWSSTESGKSGVFTLSGGSYTSIYTPAAVNTNGYTVTVTFTKQMWDGSVWKDTAATNSKTVTVTVNALVPSVPSPPLAPTGLTASSGNAEVTIKWTGVNGAVTYSVYQSTSAGFYGLTPAATVSGVTYSYTATGLTNGTTYYFTVKATNAGGDSAASNEVSATPMRTTSSSDNDSSSSSGNAAPNTPQPDKGAEVLINGKSVTVGTVTTTKTNDQTVTTITLDEKKLEEKLAAEGPHAVITVPVNSRSDVVAAELNGQTVKSLEDKQAVVEIKTGDVTYTLPAQQININAVSKQMGQNVALQDIKVQIEIAKPTTDTVKVVENAAKKGEFMLVVPPVNFIVKATYGDKTVEVSTFNAYVERTIAIPDGVDPNKITTGVVVDPDGIVHHVPTKIVKIDGKYYAKINSLTNSMYSVIWNPVEFADVANHWAKPVVSDMASRMVIDGVSKDRFEPDREITRAEFAAIVVRGLGLKPEQGVTPFPDAKAPDWYGSVINTAYSYGLISGFEDGTFRPNDKITREQAMVMIAKAMTITKLKDKLASQAADVNLSSFTDAKLISDWAKASVADSLQAGIVSGRSGNELAPKAFITRAEVASIVQRLLQKSGLI